MRAILIFFPLSLTTPGEAMSTISSTSSQSSFSTSSSSDSSTISPPSSSANTSGQTSTRTTSTASVGQPGEGNPEGNLAQLLGSLLGSAGPGGSGPAPSITVTLPGVPGFFQGLSDFVQVSSWSATEKPVRWCTFFFFTSLS